MTLLLRVTPAHAKQLALIRDLGAARLESVLKRVESESRPAIARKALRALLEREVGDGGDAGPAAVLTEQLVALAILGRREYASTQDVIESLTTGLEAIDWSAEQRAGWARVKDIVARLLNSKFVTLVAKSVDLGRDYERLLESVRILTDIRPVFDDSRDSIVGGVVTQTMRLDYYGKDGPGTLSIVLDHTDLTRLLEACQIARDKAQKATQLVEQSGAQAVRLGDDADGSR